MPANFSIDDFLLRSPDEGTMTTTPARAPPQDLAPLLLLGLLWR
jgi:hypothetical protein